MSEGKIYAAISAIQGEVGAIGKTRKNLQQGYQFRGIDDVMAHVQALQAKHGVICVPRVVEREREMVPTKSGGTMASVRLLVDFAFHAADGSCVTATTLGEAMDSGDKASNKAMSAALKYALTQVYMIPTFEADRDTEESSPELAPKPTPPKGPPDDVTREAEKVLAMASERPVRENDVRTRYAALKTAMRPAEWAALGLKIKAALEVRP